MTSKIISMQTAMTEKKKIKYHTKTVRFGGKELTMYSLDGATWSTRKDELGVIADRHEQERLKSMQSMGEALVDPAEDAEEGEDGVTPVKKGAEDDDEVPVRIAADDEVDDGDDVDDEESDNSSDEDESEIDDDDDSPAPKKAKKAKAKVVAKKKPLKLVKATKTVKGKKKK